LLFFQIQKEEKRIEVFLCYLSLFSVPSFDENPREAFFEAPPK
jgi:hypothetical protein